MPRIVRYIDEICRQKKRPVLFLTFNGDLLSEVLYEDHAGRKAIIKWLDSNGIGWEACGSLSNSWSRGSYNGEIYIDIEYDRDDERYNRLERFLERPDGTIAFQDVQFYLLLLEQAVEIGAQVLADADPGE
ncbi:hypothetical protein [Pseudomonas sp. Snoq117.2]|uniref:hypothetical protein n=1 Tax=Pseudomonas TaxID=286 RepID=UPI000B82F001|nr:hypothetical protein [Pseudomonas sp. Snoq117.2]